MSMNARLPAAARPPPTPYAFWTFCCSCSLPDGRLQAAVPLDPRPRQGQDPRPRQGRAAPRQGRRTQASAKGLQCREESLEGPDAAFKALLNQAPQIWLNTIRFNAIWLESNVGDDAACHPVK